MRAQIGGAAVMSTIAVSEALWPPLVPVTVKSAGPTVTSEAALSCSVDVHAGTEAAFTGLERNSPVTPMGRPDTLSVTSEVKSCPGVTVRV